MQRCLDDAVRGAWIVKKAELVRVSTLFSTKHHDHYGRSCFVHRLYYVVCIRQRSSDSNILAIIRQKTAISRHRSCQMLRKKFVSFIVVFRNFVVSCIKKLKHFKTCTV